MFTCLVCRSLCIEATQAEAIALAYQHGFASVEARADELCALSKAELDGLLDRLNEQGLRFGVAGMPIDVRRDQERFTDGLRDLPRLAFTLQRCGVTRLGTSIVPAHDELDYRTNFCQHVERFGAVARVLGDHGIQLGLEYCATPKLRHGRRHEFIHTLPQMRELISAISEPNLGLVIDSWHWWMSGSLATELDTLHREEIVLVDLADAPVGIPQPELSDRQRELPGATGVIDVAQFLGALRRLHWDGPVRAEPFEFPGWDGPSAEKCQRAAEALGMQLTGFRTTAQPTPLDGVDHRS